MSALSLPLVAGSRATLELWWVGLSLQRLLSLRCTGSRYSGFSSCSTWPVVVAHRLVESFQTRDRTHVSCIGRQIPHHWATREAQFSFILQDSKLSSFSFCSHHPIAKVCFFFCTFSCVQDWLLIVVCCHCSITKLCLTRFDPFKLHSLRSLFSTVCALIWSAWTIFFFLFLGHSDLRCT